MSTQPVALNAGTLQAWSNDPDAARSNLRTIFSGLKFDESISEWAGEALENCGLPFETDLEFLSQTTADHDGDSSYWACRLIGRLEAKANVVQEALTKALLSETASLATRQQAALALASIGTLTDSSREALQETSRSNDPRLARISTQALGSRR